ncbi:hypothetical protein CGCVW01_v007564 [Colletotrichum viniferum]|nr:hypothetical protein CGCVW01_v007564 [Colletotrichum viniferum]
MPVKTVAALGRFRKGNEQQHCSTTVYLMERLRASRFAVALYSSIIDFQEAQAFFTLAVQLATIVMFMTDQVPVIRIDWRAARIYSAGNTLVVLLMQSEIQRKGMRWWYMFFLSFAVGVLGMVIRNLGSEAPITLGAIAKCGNRSRNIMQTCYNNGSSAFRDAFRDEDRGGSDYFISFLFSTVVLSIDQLGHITRLRRSLGSKLEYWPGKLPVLISLLRFGSVIWCAIWFVSNVLLASLLMRNATAILNEMGGSVWDRDKWTFGQIIAVLPWAPVISKYLYCSLCEPFALDPFFWIPLLTFIAQLASFMASEIESTTITKSSSAVHTCWVRCLGTLNMSESSKPLATVTCLIWKMATKAGRGRIGTRRSGAISLWRAAKTPAKTPGLPRRGCLCRVLAGITPNLSMVDVGNYLYDSLIYSCGVTTPPSS